MKAKKVLIEFANRALLFVNGLLGASIMLILAGAVVVYACHIVATPKVTCFGFDVKVKIVDGNGYVGKVTESKNLSGSWGSYPDSRDWSVTVVFTNAAGDTKTSVDAGTVSMPSPASCAPATSTPIPSTQTEVSNSPTPEDQPSSTPEATGTPVATDTTVPTEEITATSTSTPGMTTTQAATLTTTPTVLPNTPTATSVAITTDQEEEDEPESDTTVFRSLVGVGPRVPCIRHPEAIIAARNLIGNVYLLGVNLEVDQVVPMEVTLPEGARQFNQRFDADYCYQIDSAYPDPMDRYTVELYKATIFGGSAVRITFIESVKKYDPDIWEGRIYFTAEYPDGTKNVESVDMDGKDWRLEVEHCFAPAHLYDGLLSCTDQSSGILVIQGFESQAISSEWTPSTRAATWSPDYGFGYVSSGQGKIVMIWYSRVGDKKTLTAVRDITFRPAGEKVSQITRDTLEMWQVDESGLSDRVVLDQDVNYMHNVWVSGSSARDTEQFAYGPKQKNQISVASIPGDQGGSTIKSVGKAHGTSEGSQLENLLAQFPGGLGWLVADICILALLIYITWHAIDTVIKRRRLQRESAREAADLHKAVDAVLKSSQIADKLSRHD